MYSNSGSRKIKEQEFWSSFSKSEFSSVTQSCPTLCDPMDCSTPGFPVHQLLELAQTHVLRVGEAIQTSHPLLAPSPAFNLSQHQRLFQWVSSSHQVARVWELWQFGRECSELVLVGFFFFFFLTVLWFWTNFLHTEDSRFLVYERSSERIKNPVS